MKFNRISSYLANPDIARLLILSRMLMLVGQNDEARRSLIEFFEQHRPEAQSNTKNAARRRNRILADAADRLADIYAMDSQTDRGLEFFQRLLRRNPGWSAAYRGLCRLMFPGNSHIQTLETVHKAIRPRFYVEIGVAQGDTLSRALPSTEAVGVDPRPQFVPDKNSKISVYRETSDAFFSAYEQRTQFANRKIDMAFIDGLHHFEQALRDFINVEKRSAADGLIVLHDCIPFDDVNSGRDDNVEYWVGDVWKCLAVLLDRRPDLDIRIIGAPPSGLVLVRHLNSASRALEENFDSLVKNYMPLRCADWDLKYAKRIQIIPSLTAVIDQMFAGPQ